MIYPQTLEGIAALAGLLDTVAPLAEEVGFTIGAVPLVNPSTGDYFGHVYFDHDQHAVVEFVK